MNSHLQYLDLYRRHGELLRQGSCAPLDGPRDEAAALLSALGLPGHKEERYKYTSADAAFAPDLGLNLRRTAFAGDPYDHYRCGLHGLGSALYFVVNDVPCAAPSSVEALLPGGAVVCPLRRAAQTHPEVLTQYYNKAADADRDFRMGHDGVTLLNTLLAQDGLFVYIPAGVRLERPVQIIHIADAAADLLSVRRTLIVAGEGAKASVLFCDHTEGTGHVVSSHVAEVFVGEGAEVELYSLEETSARNERFSNFYVNQSARSQVSCDSVTLTCGRSRNRLDVRLRGEGASAELCGAVIADGQQRVDHNVLVEHLAPDCHSDMLYKYVLDDHSVGAFAGKVYVGHGAQHSASQQTNANICVAPTARVYSQPMLEIYADDVKCNHGSTVGKLDEAALFYMRQRGIPEAEARLLLQHAFVNDVLRHVSLDALYERLSRLVELRFRGELEHCRGCRACLK